MKRPMVLKSTDVNNMWTNMFEPVSELEKEFWSTQVDSRFHPVEVELKFRAVFKHANVSAYVGGLGFVNVLEAQDLVGGGVRDN